MIFLKRANIVHMGDLMSHQRHPRVDRPAGASIRNWLASLSKKVVKDHNAETIYIFGHSKVGANLRHCRPRADLMALRDYFSAMLDYVQKGIAAGKSAEDFIKTWHAAVCHERRHSGFAGVLRRVDCEELRKQRHAGSRSCTCLP